MTEIKILGRGGQGAVTAAQILATAAFLEGTWSQTFPHFGAERRGAPVTAFVRLDREPISLRSKIYAPDVVIVMDHNLFKMSDPLADLKPGGLTLLNYPDQGPALPPAILDRAGRLFTVDASGIAQEIYGRTTIPITNVIVLGAYCAARGDVSLDSIDRALPDFFPEKKLAPNRQAARRGFESLRGI